MPETIPMQNYTPATKFKSQQAEWLRKVDDDNAVAVTRHGKAIAVVISPAQWRRFLELDHDHSCASTIITPELLATAREYREARTRARRGDGCAQALDALIYETLEDAASFLKRITTLMEEQSVSFDDLSKLTDIDVADLRHWIANGAPEAFDLEALLRVLNALGTTLRFAPPKESSSHGGPVSKRQPKWSASA